MMVRLKCLLGVMETEMVEGGNENTSYPAIATTF